MSDLEIPEPIYSLFDTSRGEDPAVVVVNSALRSFAERPNLAWHLEIVIECEWLAAAGMPTKDEVEVLQLLEDRISPALTADQNAIFLARVTCRGRRELLYRVRDPELANNWLQRLVEAASEREWEFRMEHDVGWGLAKPVLGLFNQDPSYN